MKKKIYIFIYKITRYSTLHHYYLYYFLSTFKWSIIYIEQIFINNYVRILEEKINISEKKSLCIIYLPSYLSDQLQNRVHSFHQNINNNQPKSLQCTYPPIVDFILIFLCMQFLFLYIFFLFSVAKGYS